jgi:hypothetical protein
MKKTKTTVREVYWYEAGYNEGKVEVFDRLRKICNKCPTQKGLAIAIIRYLKSQEK